MSEPKDLGIIPNHRKHRNIRSVKMMNPICQSNPKTGFVGCQEKPNRKADWWNHCTHDPYYSKSEIQEDQPNVIDELDDEGEPTGRKIVDGVKTIVWYEENPNLKQVTMTVRAAGFYKNLDLMPIDTMTLKRSQGLILPQEHPDKPLDPFCEYHDCWSQNPKVNTRYGNFCDDYAAKLQVLDARGKPMEVLSDRVAREQIEEISIR